MGNPSYYNRITMVKHQKTDIDFLIKVFKLNPYPNSSQIAGYSTCTNMTNRQIYAWFNRHRQKFNPWSLENKNIDFYILYLKKQYENNNYPSRKSRQEYSQFLCVDYKYVNDWFKLQRIKDNLSRKKLIF